MAALFDRVERLLERVLEAPTRRLFRTRLQPVELARALGRSMEAGALVGPNGLVVPNHYTVTLHPTDYDAFASWRQSLERDLGRFVAQRARSRGWSCPSMPVVQIVSDPAVPLGRPVVRGQARDVEAGARDVEPLQAAAGLEQTAVLAVPGGPAEGRAASSGKPWLELADGRRVRLDAPTVRLGRAPDNDVVLDDPSVSRYHASIRIAGDRCTLVDLGSHNGTRVGTSVVTEHALLPNEVIYLGAVPVRFRRRG